MTKVYHIHELRHKITVQIRSELCELCSCRSFSFFLRGWIDSLILFIHLLLLALVNAIYTRLSYDFCCSICKTQFYGLKWILLLLIVSLKSDSFQHLKIYKFHQESENPENCWNTLPRLELPLRSKKIVFYPKILEMREWLKVRKSPICDFCDNFLRFVSCVDEKLLFFFFSHEYLYYTCPKVIHEQNSSTSHKNWCHYFFWPISRL